MEIKVHQNVDCSVNVRACMLVPSPKSTHLSVCKTRLQFVPRIQPTGSTISTQDALVYLKLYEHSPEQELLRI